MTKKIAIVDDEPDLLRLLKAALEAKHFNVVTAEDGTAGLELVKKHKPDLLVSDIQMPGMNGYELVLALQKDPSFRSMPIIVLTSLTENTDKADADWRESIRTADFITKPIAPSDLIERIERILSTCTTN